MIIAVIAVVVIIFFIFLYKKDNKQSNIINEYDNQSSQSSVSPIQANNTKPKEIEKSKTIKSWGKRLEPANELTYTIREIIKKYQDDIVVVDLETTGLNFSDEILQLSIIDFNGEILFNEYIKPKTFKEWPNSQKIHNISPAKVKNKKNLDSFKEELKKLLKDKIVLGYNIDFDYKYLIKDNLITENYCTIDVMKPFAIEYGEWNNYFKSYKYQTLETCAKYYNYTWIGKTHNALSDTQATLHCFKHLKKANITFWKEINYQEEKERDLKQKFDCKEVVDFCISKNTKKSIWCEDIACLRGSYKTYKNINFKLGQQSKQSKAKPPIEMYSGKKLLGKYYAGTRIYNLTQNFDNNKKYELKVGKRRPYQGKDGTYCKAYLLEI